MISSVADDVDEEEIPDSQDDELEYNEDEPEESDDSGSELPTRLDIDFIKITVSNIR